MVKDLNTIFISGVPGHIGTDLVKILSDRKVNVKVLVHKRPHEMLDDLPGVEVMIGDLADKNELEKRVAGCDHVFVNSPSQPDMVRLQTNLIDAAKSSGVGHIVKFSVLGASVSSPINYSKWHGEIEQYLVGTGVPYTIIRSNTFMQNFLGQMNNIAKQGMFYGASSSDTKVSFVDARDIAAVAASIMTENGHEGKTYLTTGPKAITNQDIAKVMSKVTGRQVRYADLGPERYEATLRNAGYPDWMASDLAKAGALTTGEGRSSPIPSRGWGRSGRILSKSSSLNKAKHLPQCQR